MPWRHQRRQNGPKAIVLATVVALCATLSVDRSRAEDYPARPVRIVVGYAAGASGDITARILAQALSKHFNRQFTIENRPGAGSNIGTTYVAHAAADGYTLLQASVSNGIIAATLPNLTYDLAEDFAPITLFATLPNILVVNEQIGVHSVDDLIALARMRPNFLSFGSSGVGSGSHFSGELFNVMAGVAIQHVPYPSTAQAATDLLAGRIHVMFSPASTVPAVPLPNAGWLRSPQRARSAPAPRPSCRRSPKPRCRVTTHRTGMACWLRPACPATSSCASPKPATKRPDRRT